MSTKDLSNKLIVERLLAIREYITNGLNDQIESIDAVIHIDSLINSFSDEPLDIENYNFILHFKKQETEQIRKAIEKGELKEAKILFKYAHYVSKNEFPAEDQFDKKYKNLVVLLIAIYLLSAALGYFSRAIFSLGIIKNTGIFKRFNYWEDLIKGFI